MYTPIFVTLLAVLASAYGNKCPHGGDIYASGISEKGKSEVVNVHNKLRWMIANEKVPGQPRGINLKRLSYDNVLEEKARLVSATCEKKHIKPKDDRFYVGQNLYKESSSVNKPFIQNWEKAINKWFNEHKRFVYPNGKTTNGDIIHYTQVVWAETTLIGCDFIAYFNTTDPATPYTKLYTCNYGTGGNIGSRAPYETGTSGCEDLC